jgi:6-phosphogluconolactonase/glucosamine-6-phosphate isomerase/deaminase
LEQRRLGESNAASIDCAGVEDDDDDGEATVVNADIDDDNCVDIFVIGVGGNGILVSTVSLLSTAIG